MFDPHDYHGYVHHQHDPNRWYWAVAAFVIGAVCVVFMMVALNIQANKIDGLEESIEILETVRIEVVVPDGDGA